MTFSNPNGIPNIARFTFIKNSIKLLDNTHMDILNDCNMFVRIHQITLMFGDRQQDNRWQATRFPVSANGKRKLGTALCEQFMQQMLPYYSPECGRVKPTNKVGTALQAVCLSLPDMTYLSIKVISPSVQTLEQ